MSVEIEALIVADDVDPYDWLKKALRFPGSVPLLAHQIRELGLIVGYDPIKNVPGVPDNPYHGEVWTSKPSKRFRKGEQKRLLNAAKWYVEMEGVDIR